MSVTAQDPSLSFVGGADETLWERADVVVRTLKGPLTVTDLGGGSWRISDLDRADVSEAIAALEGVLDEIDRDWRAFLQVGP